ncbi:hypothetical protein [Methanosarcina sp.]|uniref:hypothetical protein n=1 Tax=Methanosarcina sp. TaxID=2213 RepID=UPI003C7650D4
MSDTFLTLLTEAQKEIRPSHFSLSASGYGQKSEGNIREISGYTGSKPISKTSTNIKPYVPTIILFCCIRNLTYYVLISPIAESYPFN